jgi:hypothetical protein
VATRGLERWVLPANLDGNRALGVFACRQACSEEPQATSQVDFPLKLRILSHTRSRRKGRKRGLGIVCLPWCCMLAAACLRIYLVRFGWLERMGGLCYEVVWVFVLQPLRSGSPSTL